MRPFRPEPLTRRRSTPSSPANLRTDGLACDTAGDAPAGSRGTGSGLLIGTTGAGAGAGRAGAAAGSGDFLGGGAAAGEPAVASSRSIKLPFDTLSPFLMRSSFTTPAAGDGISIVALSDST